MKNYIEASKMMRDCVNGIIDLGINFVELVGLLECAKADVLNLEAKLHDTEG